MNEEPIPRQRGEPQVAASAPSLPDLNAETYPFELVQSLLDEAAYLNIFSVSDQQHPDCRIYTTVKSGGVIGINVSEVLHRFSVTLQGPTLETGLWASDVVGERVGSFNQRWMIIPHDFEALPGLEPPPTLLDPSRSQRFVMLDGICTFGNESGFRGFGAGQTFPVTINGQRQLLAGAVGNIIDGFGELKGHEGTYTYCGSLDARRGFTGSLLCRVADPRASLSTDTSLRLLEQTSGPEPGITYILFRGQKKDGSQKTTYSFGPDGQVNGLNVEQQLRLFHVDFTTRDRRGVRSVKSVGQVIGKMAARVFFNLLNPGAPGTGDAPVPFRSNNEFTFFDREGRINGSITTAIVEGRTFNMQLPGAPGQAALRFGGFGPILESTGQFKGLQGLAIDNSVVGVAPHAISGLYLMRIHDPDGKFRAAISAA